jgi:hypothetical protein
MNLSRRISIGAGVIRWNVIREVVQPVTRQQVEVLIGPGLTVDVL